MNTGNIFVIVLLIVAIIGVIYYYNRKSNVTPPRDTSISGGGTKDETIPHAHHVSKHHEHNPEAVAWATLTVKDGKLQAGVDDTLEYIEWVKGKEGVDSELKFEVSKIESGDGTDEYFHTHFNVILYEGDKDSKSVLEHSMQTAFSHGIFSLFMESVDLADFTKKHPNGIYIEIVPGYSQTRLEYHGGKFHIVGGKDDTTQSWHNFCMSEKQVTYEDLKKSWDSGGYNLAWGTKGTTAATDSNLKDENYNVKLYQGRYAHEASRSLTPKSDTLLLWTATTIRTIVKKDATLPVNDDGELMSPVAAKSATLIHPKTYEKSGYACPGAWFKNNSYCTSEKRDAGDIQDYQKWLVSNSDENLKTDIMRFSVPAALFGPSTATANLCPLGDAQGYRCYTGKKGFVYELNSTILPDSKHYLLFTLADK